MEGARQQTKAIEQHYLTVAPFIAKVAVRSNEHYQLLRNALAKTPTSEQTRRRKNLRGENDVSFPQLPPMEAVDSFIREDTFADFTIRRAVSLWEIPSRTPHDALQPCQWILQDSAPTQGVFRGKMFTLSTCLESLGAQAVPRNDTDLRTTLLLYIWSDGGRVDQNKTISVVKLIDRNRIVLPNHTSEPALWFHCLGPESCLSHLSELRCTQISQVESTDWKLDGKIFHVQFRYIAGDNSCLWKEAGQSGSNTPWRCVHCNLAADQVEWTQFAHDTLRRTLKTQSLHQTDGHFGVKRRPFLAWNGLLLRPQREVLFAPALMHNLRAVLRVLYVLYIYAFYDSR